jgi:hypothetical protein
VKQLPAVLILVRRAVAVVPVTKRKTNVVVLRDGEENSAMKYLVVVHASTDSVATVLVHVPKDIVAKNVTNVYVLEKMVLLALDAVNVTKIPMARMYRVRVIEVLMVHNANLLPAQSIKTVLRVVETTVVHVIKRRKCASVTVISTVKTRKSALVVPRVSY